MIVNGALVQQEGMPGLWTGGAENCGIVDTRCDVNDAGDFTFATNTDGPATADEYIVTNVGGVWGFSAKEGDAVPALPGNTYGDVLHSALILADGTSGFLADGITGTVTTTTDEIAVLGAAALMQKGVTIPTGQAGGGMEFMEVFDFQDYWTSADGSSWLILGDLTGATTNDDVVVVNGAVVLQEDSIIPGSGFTNPIDSFGIISVHMDDAGNWYAAGNNDSTEQDWVVRNGNVIAAVGDPVVTGSTELWDDAPFAQCYFLHVGNTVGDYVIGGVTDNADSFMNGVFVLNGSSVICRESDPVDLDGNGIFDDDTFINTFGNDDGHLTDAGIFYMVVTLKNGAGTSLGQGFFSIDTSGVSTGVAFCDPMDVNSTGASTTLIAGLGSGVGSDFHLEVSSGPPGQFAYFLIGTASSEPGLVLSQGRLCLSVVGGNAVGRYNVLNTVWNSVGLFDASGILQNSVGTSLVGSGFDVPSNVPISGIGSITVG